MKLYVDDLRECPEGWLLARTNTDAIRILSTGYVEEVSIDHDIVVRCKTCPGWPIAEETFQPVAYYLGCMPKILRPKVVTFHTANPAGAAKMMFILKLAGIASTYVQGSYYIDKES